MWLENDILREDMDRICAESFIPWDKLKGKTVFITGATGLIGSTIIDALLYYEKLHPTGLQVFGLVQSATRAKEAFADQLANGCALKLVEGSLERFPKIDGDIDYIIHCACPTKSAFFVSNPVDTLISILQGTENILSLARAKNVRGVVYLSSMEVYGELRERRRIAEDEMGYLDPLSPRSSYPMGKRAAETLCFAYQKQYGVPVTIARLSQTFGPGVRSNDSRVFAYMARCALSGEDIFLHTDGSKENMYVYLADAVSAILLLLTAGKRGEAYNVANEETYCSVREMGELVLRIFGGKALSVHVDSVPEKTKLYPPKSCLRLDTAKLRNLGWRAYTSLPEMYRRMVENW